MTGEEKQPTAHGEKDIATAAAPLVQAAGLLHAKDADLEELYRTKVGTRLGAVAAGTRSGSQKSKTLSLMLSAGVVVAVLAIILFVAKRNGAPPSADSGPRPVSTRYIPQRQNVVNGTIAIKAGDVTQYSIKILPEMYEATLKGSFQGVDGDIVAVIAEESDYQNWIKGRPAQVLWGTDKPRASGTFDVLLRPGTYYFVLSNKFSPQRGKNVSVEAALNFKRLETY